MMVCPSVEDDLNGLQYFPNLYVPDGQESSTRGMGGWAVADTAVARSRARLSKYLCMAILLQAVWIGGGLLSAFSESGHSTLYLVNGG